MTPLPLTTALAILATGLAGYYAGYTSGVRKSADLLKLTQKAKVDPVGDDEFAPSEKSWEDAADDDDDGDDGKDGVQKFDGLREDCKMVLVVRTDLGMTKGKIAAQCGHATLMCYKAALKNAPNLIRRWETYGQTKVAVQTKGEEDLLTLQAIASSLGVVAKVVHDAGRTQIAAGSATVLGLGPAPRSVIDQISGHLKLL